MWFFSFTQTGPINAVRLNIKYDRARLNHDDFRKKIHQENFYLFFSLLSIEWRKKYETRAFFCFFQYGISEEFIYFFLFWNIRFDSNFSAETIEHWCRILDRKKRTHTTNQILLCSVCMKTDWQLDIVANFFCLSTICRAAFNYCANVNNGNRAEFSKPQTPIDILDNNNCSKIHFMIHESHRFAIIQAHIY